MEITPNELATLVKALAPEAQAVPLPPIVIDIPRDLLHNQKIPLIKAHRTATGLGLADSKHAVDTGRITIPANKAKEFIDSILTSWNNTIINRF